MAQLPIESIMLDKVHEILTLTTLFNRNSIQMPSVTIDKRYYPYLMVDKIQKYLLNWSA